MNINQVLLLEIILSIRLIFKQNISVVCSNICQKKVLILIQISGFYIL